MKTSLHVLLVEDSEDDARLVVDALEAGGLSVQWRRVETSDQMQQALRSEPWDIVVADYSLPQFTGPDALLLLQGSGLDVPFLLVSGTIGEERAVECLLAGASDFIVKDRLARLVPAVERELREAADRAERRQAESALRFSELKYRRLFDSLNDAAFLVEHASDRVVDVNTSGELLLQRERSETLGLKLNALHIGPAHEAVEQLSAAANQLGAARSAESEVLCKDGRVIPVLVTAIPVVVANRRLVLLLERDLTEQKKAEEKLRRLHAELEQRVEQRTEELRRTLAELEAFSYSVSHDLRSPLLAVEGLARALEEGRVRRDEAEHARLVRLIRGEVGRMGRLIDDILAFSRAGRQPLDTGVVDMTELTRGTFQDIAETIERKPRLELGSLPAAIGDRAMLRQVLTNLLANAVKFTRPVPDPAIQVTGRVEGEMAVYDVRDNGVGFDPRHGDRLFNVFQRLHRECDFEGTGVGLAIVKRIIERHGGRVTADGQVGAGATFRFTLPRAPTTPADTQPRPAS